MDESRILTKKVIHAVGVSRMNVAFLVNIIQSIQNIQNVGEAMILIMFCSLERKKLGLCVIAILDFIRIVFCEWTEHLLFPDI